MKKLLVLGSMFSALVLTGAGCVGNNTAVESTQTNSSTQSQPQDSSAVSGEVKADIIIKEPAKPKVVTKEVTIASFAFGPASVTVKAGTIVKWVNDDEVVHSIKSSNGGFTSSGNLNTGNSYEFKFVNPGVYDYSCGFHPSMRGTIIVE